MFSLTKTHGDEIYKEFICDLESDVLKLPTNKSYGTQSVNSTVNNISNELCSIGSIAFVIETVSVYMLGNDSIWHKI